MKEFKIDERAIGSNNPPLIISEIGINHGGDIEVAKQMVDSAKNVGAEIIKHQTHIVEDEMSQEAKKIIPDNCEESIYEVMNNFALSYEDELELKNYVEESGMLFISTPFSRAAADRLKEFDIPAYKIGSGECNNYPLIEHVASFGKPIILSTGMNDLKSIRRSVKILKKKRAKFILLHCKSEYPANIKGLKLDFINTLKKEFPGVLVGYSDHSVGMIPSISALAKGACIVEKHFTDKKSRKG